MRFRSIGLFALIIFLVMAISTSMAQNENPSTGSDATERDEKIRSLLCYDNGGRCRTACKTGLEGEVEDLYCPPDEVCCAPLPTPVPDDPILPNGQTSPIRDPISPPSDVPEPPDEQPVSPIDESKFSKRPFPKFPLPYMYISSRYGLRIHPITGTSRLHEGLDLGAGFRTPVKSIERGGVVLSGWYGGYGNLVEIQHPPILKSNKPDSEGLYACAVIRSTYAHNNALLVRVGDIVRAGQTIALADSTGSSTGHHLHLEIRRLDGRCKANGEVVRCLSNNRAVDCNNYRSYPSANPCSYLMYIDATCGIRV